MADDGADERLGPQSVLILLAITFIEMLLPESSMGKYLRLIFSLVIMATILYPVIRLTGGV